MNTLKEFLAERIKLIRIDFIKMLKEELPKNGFTDVIVCESITYDGLDFRYLKCTAKFHGVMVKIEFSHSGFSIDARDTSNNLLNEKSSMSIKGLATKIEKSLNPKKKAIESLRNLSN